MHSSAPQATSGSTAQHTRRLMALFAAAVVLLTACAGSEEPEATSTEPTVAPTTEALPTGPTELDRPTAPEAATEPATPTATETATDMTTAAPAAPGTGGNTSTGGDEGATGDDIAQALEDAGLPSVAAAVQSTGLADQLADLPEFTVFAPSEDAFGTLGAEIVAMDPAELQDVLTYHVVDQRILTADLSEGENTFTTVQGSDLTVTAQGGEITVGNSGATVTEADVQVGDTGVIQVIDMVLEP